MSDVRQVSVAPSESAPRPSFVKRFDHPDRVVGFGDGHLDVITIGGRLLAKGSFAPGWKWTPAPGLKGSGFTGVVLSGRAKIQVKGGESADLAPGDFFSIGVLDECWVVGLRPCEILYVGGIDDLI